MKTSPAKIRSEIRARGQVTIPASVRQAVHIDEGDLVELEVTADGILMRPLKTIDAAQAWFWTEEWQAGEREAAEDIKAKRTTRFKSGRALLASLKK